MIRNFYYDAMDADTILNMVFNLLAAYVGMLNVLVREYYFDKGRFPDNLDMYASLFKELLDELRIYPAKLMKKHIWNMKDLMELTGKDQKSTERIMSHVFESCFVVDQKNIKE